jgi:competence protein ComEA
LLRRVLGLICAAAIGVGVVCLIQSRPLPGNAGVIAVRAVPVAAVDGTGGSLDLNQADIRLLDGLPGIGPALAGRIIEYRQTVGAFADERELTRVSGIGEKISERLYPLVYAGD